MKISEKLQDFCYCRVLELAKAFNAAISEGKEYEIAFDEVMSTLDVPQSDRENILATVKYISQTSGLPYHKLSPFNQFIVTVPPYVLYNFENKLPESEDLKAEAANLKNNDGFPRYLQKILGIKACREIKGALYLGPRWLPLWFRGTVLKLFLLAALVILTVIIFQYREHIVLRLFSYIVGIVLIIVWLVQLVHAKVYTKFKGSIHQFTVWQLNILPLLTAICLFLTGNIMFIPLGVFFGFLPILLIRFFQFDLANMSPMILSLVYGWHIGINSGELLVFTFPYWRLASGITGVVLTQIVCSLIVSFVKGRFER